MFLFLDKTIEQVRILIVDDAGKIIKMVVKKGKKDILSVISSIIGKQRISGVITVAGPDSFSISRGKVSIANTISFAWGIPAVGLDRRDFSDEKNMIKAGIEKIKKDKSGKIVLPIYDRDPNITIKKGDKK